VPPKTILLIEPDEAERQELAALLEKMGYQVDMCGTSTEGLRTFNDRRHDLVIVEVLIPGMNGLQVCKIVKEQGEPWAVKVIVVSKVYHSRAMAHDAVSRFKADAYFSRPFPVFKLLEKVGEFLGDPGASGRLRAQSTRAAKRSTEPPPPPEAKPESPPPAPPKPEPRAAQPAVTFVDVPPPPDEGEFIAGDLGGILAKLGREGASGLLELKSEGQVKHVFFTDGKPVFVKSTIPEESLGRMLLADQVITHQQYSEATVEMAETGKRFGTVIAAMGLVSPEDLYYHLVAQTRKKIARCFAWPRGSYRVDREVRYPADATTFENDPVAVVLEGYRNFIDAGPLEEAYERHHEHYLFLGDPAPVAAVREHLTLAERELLNLADGNHHLADVIADSQLGLLAALRLINALVTLGAVRLAQVERQSELEGYESEPPPSTEPPESDPRDADRARRLKALFVRMEDLNYFELLGVARGADDEAIHAAFRRQQKEYHPDTFTLAAPQRLHKMAVTVSRRLHQALETLTTPERRREYEAQLAQAAPPPAGDATERPAIPATPAERERQAAYDFQQGIVALEQGQYPIAIEAFKRAVDLSPKDIDCRAKLATAMFKQLEEPDLQWSDVESVAKQALAIDPKRSDMLELVGRVKTKVGDDETALRYFQKAFELDPKNQDLRREVHYAEQRLKKAEKGWSLFGKKT